MNLARELKALSITLLQAQEKIRLLQAAVGFDQLYEIYSTHIASVRYGGKKAKEKKSMDKAGIDPTLPLITVTTKDGSAYEIRLIFTSRYTLGDYETIESVSSVLSEEDRSEFVSDMEMLENILLSNAVQFFETAPPSYRISQPGLAYLDRSTKRSWSYSYRGERYGDHCMRFVAFEAQNSS